MLLFYFSILHLIFAENFIIYSDCKHLILPSRCQCYHTGEKSQLHCHNIQLEFLPKLPNNMHWNALDFSLNHLQSIESYVLSDIYVEKLDLKFNSIETIDTTAFERVQNLKELFINHNQLKTFDPDILKSPGMSLEIFDISSNPLEYLNLGEILFNLPVLKEFHGVFCQLNDTSLYTLLNFTDHAHHSIELIDLSSNNLTSLCQNIFSSFYNLIELRLNNNQIRAIDNYLIYSLNNLKILNLAFNFMESIPNLFSSSLEYFNLSSNNIRSINDYFASNLRSIRVIDFDFNQYLNSISSRAFCFINISILEKLSFRSNNLSSIDTFFELLCRNQHSILDLNNNLNFQCNCMLIQFEKYLMNYHELTCIQQGQDRYFIPNIVNSLENCTWNSCLDERKKNLCQWTNAEQLNLEGSCYMKYQLEIKKTTIEWNMTDNSTKFYGKSNVGSRKKMNLMYFFILYVTFHKF